MCDEPGILQLRGQLLLWTMEFVGLAENHLLHTSITTTCDIELAEIAIPDPSI